MRFMMLFHLKTLNIYLEKSNISFGEGGGEGQESSEDTFLLKKERKILLPNRLKK